MITKYASKPNFNPNEPNAAWPKLPASGWHLQAQLVGDFVIPAKAGIQVFLLEAGSWLLEAGSQKRTQFFHDQICVINIKNAETEAKNRPKKTKRTQS